MYTSTVEIYTYCHTLSRDCALASWLDALHLQGCDDVRRQLGILRQLLADLLDQLLYLVEVGVIGEADRQLVDHPIAAHVLNRAQLAERHGVERPAVMPQLDGAQAEGLHGPLVAAALDVLADPAGVVEQVEHAADDVLDDRLRAEESGRAHVCTPET